MKTENLILIDELCSNYKVERVFFSNLNEIGLIEIHVVENVHYVHTDVIGDVEKMIRLYTDLDLNPEGIDVVFHLLRRIDYLTEELSAAKSRLRLYEDF